MKNLFITLLNRIRRLGYKTNPVNTRYCFFIARQHVDARYWYMYSYLVCLSVCPSVCPSVTATRSGIISNGCTFLHRTVAKSLSIKHVCEILTGSPPCGRQIQMGYKKFAIFRPITRKRIQDSAIVTMEGKLSNSNDFNDLPYVTLA